MKCPHCAYSNSEGVKFCLNCGHEIVDHNENYSIFYLFAHRVDKIPRNERSVEPKFRNIFSRVFRQHSEMEAERLFIVGTGLTTPKIEEVVNTWPKPWLFARVFLIALVAYLGLYLGVSLFENINFIPGLIVVGAFAVPFTTLIFFWEMNAPQNIAIYKIVYVVFIGGILSLLLALVFYDILGNNTNVIVIGICEELAKVIAVIYFVRNLKYRYILNGLLLGAAIGAGFAAFETAGYALRALLSGSFHMLYSTILWRSIFAPGGHVAWAALTGAAICIVQEDKKFQWNMLVKLKFLGVFLLVVFMHALWDSPILGVVPAGHTILTVVLWILVFSMIRIGLKEIADKKLELTYSKENPTPS
ncbi:MULTISPECIES: PrsW family intramembrane metalloprotease [Priestia]|uniref:PrsW family intramembrane metalloprotease n=1 Tax=Priestia TaxID=2800373 RepID=UPI0012B9E0B7|nr:MULTISPECIES: PrsW family intramembrane metalloprotease [Priestia]MEB4857669.1 PrsW family intramembrane metalloprotease [Priestia megaterium]WJN43050.1 PrsW family intramembrane metalloprotease [Priestia aryabhattai]